MGSSNVFGEISFEAKLRMLDGEMATQTQTFKIALMQNDYKFYRNSHKKYGDVSNSELPDGAGYTAGGKQLANPQVSQNTITGTVTVSWDAMQWTAISGDIGPTSGAIIYNDSVFDKPILGFLAFHPPFTQMDGGTLVISDISLTTT